MLTAMLQGPMSWEPFPYEDLLHITTQGSFEAFPEGGIIKAFKLEDNSHCLLTKEHFHFLKEGKSVWWASINSLEAVTSHSVISVYGDF